MAHDIDTRRRTLTDDTPQVTVDASEHNCVRTWLRDEEAGAAFADREV